VKSRRKNGKRSWDPGNDVWLVPQDFLLSHISQTSSQKGQQHGKFNKHKEKIQLQTTEVCSL
jgi:hypothetical protein